MKKYFCFYVILSVVISCQKKESPLTFKNTIYNATTLEPCKNGICPEIEINKLTAQGPDELSDSINNAIERVLISNLIINPDESPEIKTLDKAIANFISSYRSYQDEFPETSAGYVFTSNSTTGYNGEELLSIVFETYSFWGGAHGYGSTTYLNIDKQNGKSLSPENLINDLPAFLKLVEQKFRNQKEIPESESINSTGYFFENDSFILPANIGFTENEMILIYNPYEVASYAEGQITIKIALSEVAPFIKPNL
ncbi:DUF3298 domain-containing protein [Leeuwenhoekiella sp. W20_SRS_FM14]|uniref:DUF3298 and DUF4163 domain-containing protein n=1 Tax=Leeuwenhoekiella sp. W20_SRS_FM14 TaxID=3240270 RepID=UPI003F9C6241